MNQELLSQLMRLPQGSQRQDLMKELIAAHPNAELLTKIMEQNQRSPADETDEELAVANLDLDDLGGVEDWPMAGAKAETDRPILIAQIEALTERCAILAAALGACGCFGEIDDCLECRGTGRSGWRNPDPEAFGTYVAPLFTRLQKVRERAAKRGHAPVSTTPDSRRAADGDNHP